MLVDKERERQELFWIRPLGKITRNREGGKETYRREVLANNEIVPKGNNRHLSFSDFSSIICMAILNLNRPKERH